MSFRSHLADKVTVLRNVPVDDGHGGTRPDWETHIESYSCRIYSASGGLMRPELGEGDLYTHKFMGLVADVKAGDRVIKDSELYAVIQVDQIKARRHVHHIEGRLRRIPERE